MRVFLGLGKKLLSHDVSNALRVDDCSQYRLRWTPWEVNFAYIKCISPTVLMDYHRVITNSSAPSEFHDDILVRMK